MNDLVGYVACALIACVAGFVWGRVWERSKRAEAVRSCDLLGDYQPAEAVRSVDVFEAYQRAWETAGELRRAGNDAAALLEDHAHAIRRERMQLERSAARLEAVAASKEMPERRQDQ